MLEALVRFTDEELKHQELFRRIEQMVAPDMPAGYGFLPQHAILDELEWKREDAKLTPAQRDQAVSDLIDLVAAVDGILQLQAAADTDYFLSVCGRPDPISTAPAAAA